MRVCNDVDYIILTSINAQDIRERDKKEVDLYDQKWLELHELII